MTSPSAVSRQEKAAAARAAAAQQQRRRRRLTVAGATAGVGALMAGITAFAITGGGSTAKPTPSPSAQGASTAAPPWPAPDPQAVPALVAAAGLSLSQMETLDVHYHAHLDIEADGQPVLVPGNLGIAASALSPLHTHDPTGIVHIEARSAARFTLGQLFTEWNVTLSASCVGGLCADPAHQLRFYANGTRYDGDPRQLVLTQHEEVAILYAPVGAKLTPPRSYPFPAGS